MRACIFIILLLCVANPAWADYPLYSMSTECNSDGGEVLFRPLLSYEQGEAEIILGECLFQNGKLARAKGQIFPLLPYGINSGPVGWLSVWVGGVKILSKIQFECFGSDSCDVTVKVNKKGMSLCKGKYEGIQDPPFKKLKKWNCTFTPTKKFPKTRDRIEFPSSEDKKPPEPGSIVRLYEADKQFCALFPPKDDFSILGNDFSSIVQFPDGTVTIPTIETRSYGYQGHYATMKFDVNNDGQEDEVLALHARTHAEDSDTFYVYDSIPIPNEPVGSDPYERESFYRRAASRVLPDAWGDWASRIKAPWWDPSGTTDFRAQYLYVFPFRWHDVTYFATRSLDGDKSHWQFILRPEQNYSATNMCIFQQVRERY